MKKIAQKIHVLLRRVLGTDYYPKVDERCPTERFGDSYGGWDIRAGQIHGNSIVYSFGIGENASFDLALIERFGLTIHAFDPTPKSIVWVKRQNFPQEFILHEYGLAGFDGTVSFNPPENPDHVSHTILNRPATEARAIQVPVKRIATVMKELEHREIDLLKMDVEGAEYEVIEDLVKSDIRPRQLLVEFHHRFPEVGVEQTKKAVASLRKCGYRLFSISATGEEFCFFHADDRIERCCK